MRYIFLLALLLPNIAIARPVSYPEGWTIMQMNDYDNNSLHLHYSPTAEYSVGYYGELMREENIKLNTIQYNRLLKRWNMPSAQANMYLKLNLGTAEQDGEVDAAGRIGFAADYETRRFFISYENKYTDARGLYDAFKQTGQIGFAAYEADYDEVNTWLMLRVDHQPEKLDNFVITPFVRIFYDEYLAELGVSDEKDLMFNWIIRF